MGGIGSGSGGARPGAGRPKRRGKPDSISLSFRVTTEERDELKRRAAAVGLTVSEFIKMATLRGRMDWML